MTKSLIRVPLILMALIAGTIACNARAGTPVPPPAVDAQRAITSSRQTMVVAGGCFWGIQAVFQHVKGVASATSGYSGGSASTDHDPTGVLTRKAMQAKPSPGTSVISDPAT